MSFFQNIFQSEFRGSLLAADRRYQANYNMRANKNSCTYMKAYADGPYDLTGKTDLSINFAYDPELIRYVKISIDVSGSNVAETHAYEIVDALNSDTLFAENFKASVSNNSLLIKGIKNSANFNAYISNSGAESILSFNKYAPIQELPSYFERYSFENRFLYTDVGPHRLVLLDPLDADDAALITAAGLDPLNPTPDWQLLKGTNDAFWFYKRTYTTGKLSSEIKYPAGAKEGDLAKKTFYEYDGSDLISIMETPYVLQTSDLITP